MDTAPLPWIHQTLSVPRFGRYLRTTAGDADRAMQLYQWNLDVCEAFHSPLHWLEIPLRNALHARLTTHFGLAEWWTLAELAPATASKIRDAEAGVRRRRPAGYQPDDVVAALTFGFWVSLVSKTHTGSLWVPTLHGAFPHYRGPRHDLHQSLESMRLFRNRIMHHEPIYHRDLVADRATIYRLIGYLSQDALEVVPAVDRVPDILARRRSLWKEAYQAEAEVQQ